MRHGKFRSDNEENFIAETNRVTMNLVKRIQKLITVNKSNLKTAFKVWLFFALIKGIAVVCVWFGFTALIRNAGGKYSSNVHVYALGAVNKTSQLTPEENDSAITKAMRNLICTIAQEDHSLDGAGGDTKQRHVTAMKRAVRDGFVSREDLDELVKFEKLLEYIISRSEESDGFIRQISHSQSKRFPSPQLKPELLLLIQYVNKRSNKKDDAPTKNKRKLFRLHDNSSLQPWQQWQNAISERHLCDNRSITDQLLRVLVTAPVIGLEELPDSGTQIKLLLKLQDGSQAIFKPMRVLRNQERNPNIYFWNDLERHHAEIAAFHLDRILGFHRVPPTVGRFVNISADIERFASDKFKKTIYMSPAGNKCFFGICDKYCDGAHPICGSHDNRDVIEGSLATWLPFEKKDAKKQRWRHPWIRSYSRHKKADWEANERYCDVIREQPPYNKGRALLDIMDMAIFDYLTGNPDRHSYHTLRTFGGNGFPILYDNGRGFGLIHTDDPLILFPLTQCCLIRLSTLRTLIKMAAGPDVLSARMKRSLDQDPLSSGPNGPLLSLENLRALDRRLGHVLEAVWECSQSSGLAHVILD